MTTSISVNGTTYTQVDGLITLPNYPTTVSIDNKTILQGVNGLETAVGGWKETVHYTDSDPVISVDKYNWVGEGYIQAAFDTAYDVVEPRLKASVAQSKKPLLKLWITVGDDVDIYQELRAHDAAMLNQSENIWCDDTYFEATGVDPEDGRPWINSCKLIAFLDYNSRKEFEISTFNTNGVGFFVRKIEVYDLGTYSGYTYHLIDENFLPVLGDQVSVDNYTYSSNNLRTLKINDTYYTIQDFISKNNDDVYNPVFFRQKWNGGGNQGPYQPTLIVSGTTTSSFEASMGFVSTADYITDYTEPEYRTSGVIAWKSDAIRIQPVVYPDVNASGVDINSMGGQWLSITPFTPAGSTATWVKNIGASDNKWDTVYATSLSNGSSSIPVGDIANVNSLATISLTDTAYSTPTAIIRGMSVGNDSYNVEAVQVNADWNASSGVAEILNKPTIPTVNDGALTIKVNNATVGSFSANASTSATANIECVRSEEHTSELQSQL